MFITSVGVRLAQGIIVTDSTLTLMVVVVYFGYRVCNRISIMLRG
jgi:hypothetical protein